MRTTLKVSTVALAVAIASGHAVVRAQTPAQEQQAAGWVFTPSIRVGGAWDDNVVLVNAGDHPPADYTTPLTPAASLDYRGRRTRLSSGYEGSFLRYQTFSELNSAEQRLRALLEHRLTSRLTLFAEEDFADVPTTDMLELAGIPFFRVGSQMNTASGGFEAAIARHTSLRTKYTHQIVTFDANDRFGGQLQGGHAHEVLVALGRALSSRLTLGSEYEVRRAVVSHGDDQFDSHTGSMTAQYAITPALTVSGLLGVTRLGAGGTHEPRIGPAVRAGIVRRARTLVLSAMYQRSFIPSFGFGGTFQNEELQGNIHVPFANGRAYADGSVARLHNDPLEATQPTLVSLWISGTLGYRATRWLSFEGFYSQSQQSTRRAGGDLDRHQVGFRIHAAKPMRLQ